MFANPVFKNPGINVNTFLQKLGQTLLRKKKIMQRNEKEKNLLKSPLR